LREESFGAFVWEVWSNNEVSEVASAQKKLKRKLKMLKCWVKEWVVLRKIYELCSMENIEAEIAQLTKQSIETDYCFDPGPRLKSLESDRNKLLLADEEHWRQKRRATWIHCGEKNTNFFHRFASFRRNKKYPWEVSDEMDWVHSG
jgi:hypothetical protein